jgi:hypothetical protein
LVVEVEILLSAIAKLLMLPLFTLKRGEAVVTLAAVGYRARPVGVLTVVMVVLVAMLAVVGAQVDTLATGATALLILVRVLMQPLVLAVVVVVVVVGLVAHQVAVVVVA